MPADPVHSCFLHFASECTTTNDFQSEDGGSEEQEGPIVDRFSVSDGNSTFEGTGPLCLGCTYGVLTGTSTFCTSEPTVMATGALSLSECVAACVGSDGCNFVSVLEVVDPARLVCQGELR